jgi:CheB methylesterase
MPSSIGQPRVPVVAIGASAGGIKALQQFFDRIPSDTGACFVVIVHLAPDYESHLAEIIGTRSSMPAATVDGGAELQPNHTIGHKFCPIVANRTLPPYREQEDKLGVCCPGLRKTARVKIYDRRYQTTQPNH